ncbi:MAG: diversity-generating retroelement protein Avd [Deinococcus sp.]|nr:diversity-generating retroelement protein Avd [Deinococcus sp.]
MQQSPVFVRVADLMEWLLPRLGQYPRSQRSLLAAETAAALFGVHRGLLEAVKTKDRRALRRADVELERLRMLLRLGETLQCLSVGQYEHAMRLVVEVGKLLGAWQQQWGRGTTQTQAVLE